ncbi:MULTISPECIES: hypothetical protein [Shewanella]|uniref:DUF4760 domain-containing protein n=1 Tax=Shewanella insulae TaxID=2681496 RepID=A0A6L7HZS7_9GAMM|nr:MULTISPECIES: hypothetical protein [Shewanella]MCL2908902.1 hypothetical protein [Shewanella aquimarina]MXR69756.1 hypothetical protein [Shewanella insulae]
MKDYQPELYGFLLAIGLLNLWYLTGVAIEESVLPKNYDFVIKFFTVGVGGFAGAYSAFKLKSYQDRLSEEQRRVSALNWALFILIRKYNAIENMKASMDKYERPFDRAFSLPAMVPAPYDELKIEVNELSFLVDFDKANFLMELSLEQDRFRQAMRAIEIRNEFYVGEIQPALSHYALNGRPLPLAEFQEKLGERLFEGAINGAENMYEHVYKTSDTLDKMIQSFREVAKELYPGKKFVGWIKKT